jgi:hypothetical protein
MPESAPSIITSIGANGRTTAVNLSALTAETLLPIVNAALWAATEWDNLNIEGKSESGEQAMDTLAKATGALDALMQPVLPGACAMSAIDLMQQDTYSIYRDGVLVQVPSAELTAFELKVLQRWLAFHALVIGNHAEAIGERLTRGAA